MSSYIFNIKNNNKFNLIQFIIGILIFILLIYWINLHETWEIFKNTKWYVLPILFIIFFLDRLFMAYKWGILLKIFSKKIKFYTLAKAYLYSAFIGQIIPISISGDIVRYFKIKNKSIATSDIFTSIIIEKIFGTIAIVTAVFISMMLIRLEFKVIPLFNLIIKLISVIIIVFLLLLWISIKFNLYNQLIKFLSPKLSGKILKFKRAFYTYLAYKKIVLIFFIFCLLEQIFPIMSDFIFTNSLNINISIIQMSFIVTITLLFARLPISPTSIGFQEGILVGLFMLFGFKKEEGLAVGIGLRILGIIFTFPIGAVFFNDIFSSINSSKKAFIT